MLMCLKQHAALFSQVALQPGPADLLAVHGTVPESALSRAMIACNSMGKRWIRWDLKNVSWPGRWAHTL